MPQRPPTGDALPVMSRLDSSSTIARSMACPWTPRQGHDEEALRMGSRGGAEGGQEEAALPASPDRNRGGDRTPRIRSGMKRLGLVCLAPALRAASTVKDHALTMRMSSGWTFTLEAVCPCCSPHPVLC